MSQVMLITGTRKGIGRYLAEYYTQLGFLVIGCSRSEAEEPLDNYKHYCLDVADEAAVQKMVHEVAKEYGRIDILINNAGIASMNHILLTPMSTVKRIFETNVFGTFLFAREVSIFAKISSRENISNSLFAKISSRENNVLYSNLTNIRPYDLIYYNTVERLA